jgi:hypothetical protein
VSLPPSLLLTQVGFTLVVVGILAKLGVRQPFPVSSIPTGAIFRPGVLVINEDIVAVDGGQRQIVSFSPDGEVYSQREVSTPD